MPQAGQKTDQTCMIARWVTEKLGFLPSGSTPAPDHPIQVIGDIHGRFDLLENLLSKLDPDLPIICVGDYVDRGERSADVLRLLEGRTDIICLMGNHEAMMLDFLANPSANGSIWLRNGGLQTLASFGIAGLTETSKGPPVAEASEALRHQMGHALVDWVQNLPLHYVSGNVAAVHAAADPSLAIEQQSTRHLLWGHPAFLTTRRRDDMWIVHGHTIVDAPQVTKSRIAIDTGAYATGRLTAALITKAGVEFITAGV